MSEEPQRRRLEIPAEVARAEGVPGDLDASAVGPYMFPSTRRRRKAGLVYLASAALVAVGVVAGLPRGLLFIIGLLLLIAGWHLLSAWPLRILDPEALDVANRAIEFPVGHASAAVGFDGWRARPIWNVLVFSADSPPSQRGLVRVDAVDGHVVETYTEANPEIE